MGLGLLWVIFVKKSKKRSSISGHTGAKASKKVVKEPPLKDLQEKNRSRPLQNITRKFESFGAK